MTELATTGFDYSQLRGADWKFVQDATDVIHQIRGQAVAQIGEQLAAVKGRLAHGLYGEWLEKEFQWGQREAERYVNVWREFGKIDNFVEISRRIDRSAQYLLAAPSTPEPARLEVLSKVAAGEHVTYKKAKEIVQQHKQLKSKPQSQLYPEQRARAIAYLVRHMRRVADNFGPGTVRMAVQTYGMPASTIVGFLGDGLDEAKTLER